MTVAGRKLALDLASQSVQPRPLRVVAVIQGLAKSLGGPSYSATALSSALHDLQVERILVPACSQGDAQEVLPEHPQVRIERAVTLSQGKPRVVWPPAFRRHLDVLCQAHAARILHAHGIWIAASHDAAVVARRRRLPLVISPHGMLCGWAIHHKRWKKRLAWWLYQARDLRTARVLHATAQDEAKDLRKLGLRNPIAVVPHGIDLPTLVERSHAPKQGRTLLFLSRIHPKKGLLNLVEAWANFQPAGWRVVIAGPDEGGHRKEVQEAIQSRGLDGSFAFVGEVSGEAKWDLIRSSDVFVLPSFSENFGLVIAEALGCGLPVITTKATPWEELASHGCGWWIETGVEPLVVALREALQLPDAARREMGLRGRRLVEKNYTWPSAAARMKEVYEWALSGGPLPACVTCS